METLEWFARAWDALDISHRLFMLAGAALFVYGVYPALAQKKEGEAVPNRTTINIHGPAQVGDGNVQHNTLNVNAAAVYSRRGEVAQSVEGGKHRTIVRIPLTDGPWDASTQSAIEIRLSAPWQGYEITGFPGAQMNVQIGEHPEQGLLVYRTATPPIDRVVEFRFMGDKPMQVLEVGVSPSR